MALRPRIAAVLGVLTAAALAGGDLSGQLGLFPRSGAGSPAPAPGAGGYKMEYRVVYLKLLGCEGGGRRAGVEVTPDVAEIYLGREPRRVAWVVTEKAEGDSWSIEWKWAGKEAPAGVRDHFPGPKKIAGNDDTFYSPAPLNARPGDRWDYGVRVERDGKACAQVDPGIIIRP